MPLFTRCKISIWCPQSVCEVLAQYTSQINLYSLLKLPLLGYKTRCFWVCCFKCKWAVAPGEEGGASRSQAPALAVLAFANKHSTISTSLLSLQKTNSVSKSSDYTVHNKFAILIALEDSISENTETMIALAISLTEWQEALSFILSEDWMLLLK